MEEILILGSVGREKIHSFENVSALVFGGTAYYATEAILKTNTTAPLLISALGFDLKPEVLLAEFSRGISTLGLRHYPDLPSFYWEARYENSFEESVTLALENRLIAEFKPDWAAIRDQFPNIRYCYLAAFDPRIQLSCGRHFSNSFIVSETLEYWIDRDKATVLEAFRCSNGVVVTEREFRALWQFDASPRSPHEAIVNIIEEFELDFLIVTFADRGSQTFDRHDTFFVPALRCKTIDSTGAGNAFSGGIISYLSHESTYDRRRLLDAVTLGTALAGLQVQDFSNFALRRATPEDIISLQQEVLKNVIWFGAGKSP